jgi:hypothetical protein
MQEIIVKPNHDRATTTFLSPSTVPPEDRVGGAQKRQRLIALLRGYFSCPVIATLGELGLTERMSSGMFALADFEGLVEKKVLAALFEYMESTGLLSVQSTDLYELTAFGRTVITRNRACSLLMSYSDYFMKLPQLLMGKEVSPTVNRLQNVRGSGALHSNKFFPSAVEFFDALPPTGIIDIGCGDGCFLALSCEKWPGVKTFGVDLSETAVEVTSQRLHGPNQDDQVAIVSDGFDVAYWSQAVPQSIKDGSGSIISMWFVGHEFSKGNPDTIVKFFSELHSRFPRAQILLGEINNIPSRILAENCDTSIMPEFLLFHRLSGQGVLSWQSWQRIRESIPYELKRERRFDEVHIVPGQSEPASFLWLLEPTA